MIGNESRAQVDAAESAAVCLGVRTLAHYAHERGVLLEDVMQAVMRAYGLHADRFEVEFAEHVR